MSIKQILERKSEYHHCGDEKVIYEEDFPALTSDLEQQMLVDTEKQLITYFTIK